MKNFGYAVAASVMGVSLVMATHASAQLVSDQPWGAYESYNGNDTALPGGYKVGRFYGPRAASAATAQAPTSLNTILVAPIYVPNNATVQAFYVDIGAGTTSVVHMRVCLYSDTGLGYPGSLAVDSGAQTITASTTGVVGITLSSGVALAGQKYYWIGLNEDTTTSLTVFGFSGNMSYMENLREFGFKSASNLFTSGSSTGWQAAQLTTSSCSASFASSPSDANGLMVPYVAMGF
jgi:hypothetical protein